MLATSILFSNYLIGRRAPPVLIYLYLAVYLTIELSFLFANLENSRMAVLLRSSLAAGCSE
jgi:KUP system potassium uptake protein